MRRWAVAAGGAALWVSAAMSQVLETGNPAPTPQAAAARAWSDLSQPSRAVVNPMEGVSALRGVSVADADNKARADRLIAEAGQRTARGESEGVRPRLAEAAALLSGRRWDDDLAYATSLIVNVGDLVADPSRPLKVQLQQLYAQKAPDGLALRVRLATAPTPGGTGSETTVRTLWTAPLAIPDLTARPLAFEVDLAGLTDGAYLVAVDVMRGATVAGTTATPIRVVAGLAAGAAIRAEVVRRKLRPDLAATISYPFDTARAVNGWRRDIPENLDFSRAVARSRQLLAAAQAGRDPLWRTIGDQRRAYRLDEAGETMPYHLYVPKSWKPGAHLPLVMVLHGGGLNEDSPFPDQGRFAGTMQRMAEQYRVIIVAPLGFRPMGGYGVSYSGAMPPPIGVRPDVAARTSLPALSEADTMRVLQRVADEYQTDAARTYVLGNSMGGGGVWYLGAKYPRTFAGIAPSASSMPFTRYDFAALGRMPVRIAVGTRDAEVRRTLARQGYDALKKQGNEVELDLVENETHTTAWYVALPRNLEFLLRHRLADQ